MSKAPSPRELILRHVYFDEAGMANPLHEPYLVVAGIMIHVDQQYAALQKYILGMADELVGVNRPLDFHFHAKDLWYQEGFF